MRCRGGARGSWKRVDQALYPWIAVTLAVLSPVYGMLYVARGWRAVGYLATAGTIVLAILLTAYLGACVPWASSMGIAVLRSSRTPRGYHGTRAGLASIVVIVILGVTSLRAFAAEAFHISSGAMYPTADRGRLHPREQERVRAAVAASRRARPRAGATRPGRRGGVPLSRDNCDSSADSRY
jgi:hypothetical protein